MKDFLKANTDLQLNDSIKCFGSDWYVCNSLGYWNLVNLQGTDAVSINFSKNINFELFVEDFYEMSYEHLVQFIEHKYHIEKDRKYFDKYILGGTMCLFRKERALREKLLKLRERGSTYMSEDDDPEVEARKTIGNIKQYLKDIKKRGEK